MKLFFPLSRLGPLVYFGLLAGASGCGEAEESGGLTAADGSGGVGGGLGGAEAGGSGGGATSAQPACLNGQALCGSACVNLDSNISHCGACGQACVSGASCVGGQCMCQQGLADCGGSCVNLMSDGSSCGECGNTCPAGEVCSSGVCQGTCAVGQELCGTGCADLGTDPTNCGVCGTVCSGGEICLGGECSCSAGLTLCGGVCTDVLTDSSNCRDCGTACAAGQSCVAGSCVGGDPGSGGASSSGGTGALPPGGSATGGVTDPAAGGSATGGATDPAAGGSATGGATDPATGGSTTGGTIDPATGGTSTGGTTGSTTGRFMENLDRGVIAVPAQGSGVFVSWRLFGTDPDGISFNLYRGSTDSGTLVCSTGPEQGTNCTDGSGSSGDAYYVRAVIGDVEGDPSRSYEYTGRNYISIPLESGSSIHLAWTGDLDGDGDMDIVADRVGATRPLVDAYLNDGTFLWRIDMGPNSENQNNIEGGASVISNGHNDGLTVFDFNGDGRAEVAIKTAPGVIFGDGAVMPGSGETQYVSIVDGMTGAEVLSAPLSTDYASDGPLQCHFSAGYLDGVNPSIITRCKNRVGSGDFNLVAQAWDYRNGALTERWKWLRGTTNAPDFHQHRVLDVDGDGRDELCDGGHVLDEDGTLLYSLGDSGLVHGDRFHITDMDPDRPGLEGFGIQQNNPSGVETYYYDAATGEILREHCCAGGDLGRGTILDLYPEHRGYEYMSFNGMWVAGSGENLTTSGDAVPWPNFRMWWDGDLGSEHLDHQWVGEWNTEAMARNTYYWRETFDGSETARGAIPLYGDLYGDWREEAVVESGSELRIYSTNYPSDTRIYTMLHNPAYRNSLTAKGYLQSHHVDYFLGFDMDPPPRPDIRIAP